MQSDIKIRGENLGMIKTVRELVFSSSELVVFTLWIEYIISKLFGIFIMIYNKSELWSGC